MAIFEDPRNSEKGWTDIVVNGPDHVDYGRVKQILNLNKGYRRTEDCLVYEFLEARVGQTGEEAPTVTCRKEHYKPGFQRRFRIKGTLEEQEIIATDLLSKIEEKTSELKGVAA